jgi:hypothetical protein
MERLTMDYSQGLPTLGFIGALAEAGIPAEIIQLKPDETEKVKKWVEGPNALNRAQGLMKSAFYQISEGRPEPAARLVISAAVLAGFGWKDNPELAARIIETARRIVQNALAAKTGVAGLGEEMLVMSELGMLDPATVRTDPGYDLVNKLAQFALYSLALSRSATQQGRYNDAIKHADNARRAGREINKVDSDVGENILKEAREAFIASVPTVRHSVAGLSFPIHSFDSKGTMWGTGRSPSKLAVLLGMLEKVRR